MDQLQPKGCIETLIRWLSKFSEQALLIISGQSDIAADAQNIGPVLIFERLWKETRIQAAIKRPLEGRLFEFDVERTVFLTVLHRLMVSGSDRFCNRWCPAIDHDSLMLALTQMKDQLGRVRDAEAGEQLA